jgi:spermidine/putrescine transport system permease protein
MTHTVVNERRSGDLRKRWLMSTPALAIILFAASGPLLVVALYSFLTPGPYGDVVWKYSTEGWTSVLLKRDIFDDTLSMADGHIAIFGRSIWIAAATTLLTLLFGFPTAYFIATQPAQTRQIWLFLITIPFWTNLLIRTIAVLQVIRNEGVINLALIGLGVIDQPIQILFTDFATMFGMVYVYLPLMVLPLYASMERIDFRVIEAGYDLYASRFQVLRRVIVPLVLPGIVAGSILVFIPALGAYVAPTVLGGGRNMMFANLIELQFGQGRNWPLGAALSFALMAVVIVALLVYVRNMSKGAHHG